MTSRNDGQMMELILSVARNDARIRAAIQDGSRSNPSVRKDIFQDFDVIYIVKSLRPFTKDHRWVDVFGKRMIMQMPEDMELYPPVIKILPNQICKEIFQVNFRKLLSIRCITTTIASKMGRK